jgi:hypothetical protein
MQNDKGLVGIVHLTLPGRLAESALPVDNPVSGYAESMHSCHQGPSNLRMDVTLAGRIRPALTPHNHAPRRIHVRTRWRYPASPRGDNTREFLLLESKDLGPGGGA